MRNTVFRALVLLSMLFVGVHGSFAQRYPERGLTRSGNRDYDKEEYSSAELDYRRALEKNPAFYEAGFNLGDAVYRQQRFDEAAKFFTQAAADSTSSVENTALSYFNKGNAEFMQQKYSEALESYKQSLRLNPDDTEAKYNLAYTKKMLEQQQNQQEQQNQDNQNPQDNRDKGDNNDSGGDNDREQDKGDRNPDDSDKGQNRDNPDDGRNPDSGQNGDKPAPSQPQDGEGRISPQEAEQMLQAVQQQEDNTRDKVNEKRGVAVGRSGKNW